MGGFVFANKLQGVGTGTQSDDFGIFLTPILGPDGSSEPPNGLVRNSILINALLPNGIGSNPGYNQAAVFAGVSASGWNAQLDLVDGLGNNGNASAGSPGFNGNTAVFGYPTATTDFPNGLAVAWVRSLSGVWSLQQQLVPGDGAAQGSFGASCGVFGNLAVVCSVDTPSGALYAYARTGNTWAQFQQFQPADIGVGDGLAIAAMTGNQLFLSAIDQNTSTGAVYVYTFIAGAWVQTQKLVGQAVNDFFGISVGCDGVTLVIGGGFSGNGKAYVYTQSAGHWSLLTTLIASDGAAGDDFGNGVAVNGTLMCIGARNATVGIVTTAGAAYLFQFVAGTWTQTQKLTAPIPTTQTYFGWNTAVFAGTPSWAAVGAPAVGNLGVEGAVFFFKGPAIAPVSDPFVTLTFKGEKVYT